MRREFLGIDIDTDAGPYAYSRRHWAEWFPALGRVHPSTFVRQAANLWAVKQRLYQHLLSQARFDPAVSLVDSVACSAWPVWSVPSRVADSGPLSLVRHHDR